MRRSKLLRIIYITLIIALFISTAMSCQGKEEKPKPPEDKKDEIPKELSTIEEKVEEVQKEMEKLIEEIEKPIDFLMAEEQKKKEKQGEEQGKSGQEGQGGEEQGGGEQGQQGESQSQGQGEEKKEQGDEIEKEKKKTEMKKEQNILMMRDSLLKKVEEIHTQWNSYETKAIEDGASEEDIANFEEALNNLTMAVDEKNDIDALMNLNNITLHMARFYDFYKGNPDGEILRLRHYSRQIYLDGRADAWDKAQENVENLKKTLDRLNQKIELSKDKENLMKNLTLSVEDYVSVIEKENKELLKIKMDIVLSNLDKVREEAK